MSFRELTMIDIKEVLRHWAFTAGPVLGVVSSDPGPGAFGGSGPGPDRRQPLGRWAKRAADGARGCCQPAHGESLHGGGDIARAGTER
jgi:hypothetical protein